MLLVLFSLFAAVGGMFAVVAVIAWYRGLLPVLYQFFETMSDIVAGREILIHRISVEELIELYEEDDDEDDGK